MKSSESPRSTVFIPYWLVLPLLLFGLAGFLAIIVIGVLSGFWLVIVIGSALSAWHIVLCVRLIRMGRRGWNERASRQVLPSARLIDAKRTSAKDLGMYVLKLTNRLFLTVFTAASITGIGSVIAVVGAWGHANISLIRIGAAAACGASWITILALAVAVGRQSRGN